MLYFGDHIYSDLAVRSLLPSVGMAGFSHSVGGSLSCDIIFMLSLETRRGSQF